MTGTVALAAITGMLVVGGLLFLVAGFYGRPADQPRKSRQEPAWLARLRAQKVLTTQQLIVCAVAGFAAMIVTGWVSALLIGAIAAYGLPRLLGPDRDHKRRLTRIEAVATWTENLRDTLSAAAGLEQAIMTTALTPPAAIHDEITRLATRLRAGERLPAALRRLATELDDPTGDLVVTALVMAAERHARNVTDLLSTLARTARDQAQLRQKVAGSRASIRTNVRIIVSVTLAMAIGLAIFDRHFLAPYSTAAGQFVLLISTAIFALAFSWLSGIARIAEPSRLLTAPPQPAPTVPAQAPMPAPTRPRTWQPAKTGAY
jgi:tight adherence protein B